MAAVVCETETITGRTEVRKTLMGKRLFVELLVQGFDTNTGFEERDRLRWRKAKKADIAKLAELKQRSEKSMLIEALKEDSKRFLGGEIVWEQSETMDDGAYAELVRMSVNVESGEIFVTRSWMSQGGKPATSADINGVRIEDLPEWGRYDEGDKPEAFRRNADGHLRMLWAHDGDECSFYVARRAKVGEEEMLIAGVSAGHPFQGVVQFEKPISELSMAEAPRFG